MYQYSNVVTPESAIPSSSSSRELHSINQLHTVDTEGTDRKSCMLLIIMLCKDFPSMVVNKVLICDIFHHFNYLAGRSKFDHRAKKCVFLGYQPHTKGAILYDALRKQIFISRHVVYHSSFATRLTFAPLREPLSYSIASQHPCWVDAMNKDLQALKSNQIWIIMDKLPLVVSGYTR